LLHVSSWSILLKKAAVAKPKISMMQSVQLTGLKIMMGHRQVEQAALFYEFSLERDIPADHLLVTMAAGVTAPTRKSSCRGSTKGKPAR
jgi:hypothetical protein